ncbi:GCV3 [Candida oxycetoniae]|uniref:Glycine cleavage system H protein n=1 Tax=Candida oxycetoniae TaxID=497107 RepID=A0AAI9WWH5_9ASCO|nr:GCV3 [Candida oxycetoniae]KAI3402963.1 GCV3 [Candida oxycetoniae]
MYRSLLRPSAVAFRAFTPRSTISVRSFSVYSPQFMKSAKDSHAYKYLHEKKPIEQRFTAEHEYVNLYDDESAFLGITPYAAQALGDVTYVELPELGTKVEAGDTIGSVESVKSASEIYSPVSGEVVGVNNLLESEPGLLNQDPSHEGWIAHIKLDDPAQITNNDELMDKDTYTKSLKED